MTEGAKARRKATQRDRLGHKLLGAVMFGWWTRLQGDVEYERYDRLRRVDLAYHEAYRLAHKIQALLDYRGQSTPSNRELFDAFAHVALHENDAPLHLDDQRTIESEATQ